MLTLVLALAAAAPETPQVSRAALPPDPRRNVRESSHVLAPGELLVGLDGVGLGLAPRVQVGSQPILDAVGWVNGSAKVELVRSDPFGLSVSGGGGGAQWGEARGHHAQLRAATTLTPLPALSVHGGAGFALLSIEGVPTEAPGAIAEWLPMDELQAVAETTAAYGLTPRVYARHVEATAALEVRVNRRDSFVLSGALTGWGQNGTDLLVRIPGGPPLDPRVDTVVSWAERLGRSGNGRVSLSWRIALGGADVRLGGGWSDLPGAWAPEANGLALRAFGEARREDRRLLAEARAAAEADEEVARAPSGTSSAQALP